MGAGNRGTNYPIRRWDASFNPPTSAFCGWDSGRYNYGTVPLTGALAALSPPLELREVMVIFTGPGGRSLKVTSLSLTIVFQFGWRIGGVGNDETRKWRLVRHRPNR